MTYLSAALKLTSCWRTTQGMRGACWTRLCRGTAQACPSLNSTTTNSSLSPRATNSRSWVKRSSNSSDPHVPTTIRTITHNNLLRMMRHGCNCPPSTSLRWSRRPMLHFDTLLANSTNSVDRWASLWVGLRWRSTSIIWHRGSPTEIFRLELLQCETTKTIAYLVCLKSKNSLLTWVTHSWSGKGSWPRETITMQRIKTVSKSS